VAKELDILLGSLILWRLRENDMAKQFDKGDRVNTPLGPGSVVYKRLKHYTEYSEAEMYSVFLDSKKAEMEQPPFPSYSGTAFPADQVSERN
jgi:hypothetical protein